MIQSDLRNDKELRRYACGRIQPASQPGLKDGIFHLFLMKMQQRHHEKHLKECQHRQPVFSLCILHLPVAFREILIRDLISVHPDPFIHPDQMG